MEGNTNGYLPDHFFLTSNEVMAYLRVERWTLIRMVKSGELPAKKFRGRWRFKREDVIRYGG